MKENLTKAFWQCQMKQEWTPVEFSYKALTIRLSLMDFTIEAITIFKPNLNQPQILLHGCEKIHFKIQ